MWRYSLNISLLGIQQGRFGRERWPLRWRNKCSNMESGNTSHWQTVQLGGTVDDLLDCAVPKNVLPTSKVQAPMPTVPSSVQAPVSTVPLRSPLRQSSRAGRARLQNSKTTFVESLSCCNSYEQNWPALGSIAIYCSLPIMSLCKLQGKVVTHFAGLYQ